MSPWLRKLVLATHLTASMGWLGAVAAFLALAAAGLASTDAALVPAAYPAMNLIARFVIVPLAFASLVTGIISSLSTPWGLFRHYWVVVKLVVTVLATAVLLLQLEPLRDLANAAASGDLAAKGLREARMSMVMHSGGGLLVLLVPTALGVWKPRGRTPWGSRPLGA